MLKAGNLGFHREGKDILKDVSVELRPGELVAVVGPNGAGKSTLMKLLCRDLVPDSGTVLLEGRPLAEWNARELARVRGVLPQASELGFPLTVLEVVLIGRSPFCGVNESAHDLAHARRALEQVDLAHMEQRVYSTLSGGEKQRAHLARVLAQLADASPEAGRYYFFDEPTASLDIGHQQQMLRLARGLADAGAAVFTVLHDLNQAAVYADRILMLKQGRVFAGGAAAEVIRREIVEDVFGLKVAILPHPESGAPMVVPGF